MRTRLLLNLFLFMLMLAGSTTTVASARDVSRDAKAATKAADGAIRALRKNDAADAIPLAERAVGFAARDAGYRSLLGHVYLRAGRFQSARATLEEAMALGAPDGRTALDLVLAQIACGDWSMARRTLDAHADRIPPGDHGLAVALTGDPATAVALLTQVARQPGATAKTRQNLALALALAGQWGAAKMIAAADLSPADVDARMMEWAAFSQPRTASDQVASLLGTRAIVESDRPVGLALVAPAAPVAAAKVSTPAAPVAVAIVPAVRPVEVVAAAPAKVVRRIVFAPPEEVVQALPVSTVVPSTRVAKAQIKARIVARISRVQPKPVVKAAVAVAAPVKGPYVVQLGAFDSVEVARDAWGRATRRFAALKRHAPRSGNVRHGAGAVYRLSVGGFVRADADRLCRAYRARGGVCFVRAGSGDRIAGWLRRPGVQLAMR